MVVLKAAYDAVVDFKRQAWCLLVGHDSMVGWRTDETGKAKAIVRCPRCLAWRPHPWS